MDGQYYVVFDLALSGYKAWTSLVPGLIIFAVGLLAAFFPGVVPVPWPWSRPGVQAVGWIMAVFSAAITMFGFWVTYDEYRTLNERLAKGQFAVAEGIVENYERDRTYERFTVSGQEFAYSDFNVTSAFNNTAAEGGPIRLELQVRIVHADGKILRIEIRK